MHESIGPAAGERTARVPQAGGGTSSRIPGFYQLPVEDRVAALAERCGLTPDEREVLRAAALLPEAADAMVENAVGVLGLPLGLGLNFLVNGRDVLVPMAVEEASVVASASYAAKLVREAGGFTAGSSGRIMIGQVQIVGVPDLEGAARRVLTSSEELLAEANRHHPSMAERGGGAREVQARILNAAGGPNPPMLVVHFYIDTQDAMGANVINTMMEGVAPALEALTGGRVVLRILSNLADRCLAWSQVVLPPAVLASGDLSGEAVVDGIVLAGAFAASDPYRAATHNKGVMNGIDAVVLATGNDWRAVEAGCHAYAARNGRYGPMTTWTRDAQGSLVGRIEVPMAVGTVGGVRTNPTARLALKVLGVANARELAEVVVSVGLAQNLAAIKALATEGIQKGHMALHARNVAMAAGAQGDEVEAIAQAMVRSAEIRLAKAQELLRQYR